MRTAPVPVKDGPRANRDIRGVREVQLIDDTGNNRGIVAFFDALAIAEETGLDLVEIVPNATPPVCKILDYGKFRFLEQKKAAEARKKQKVVEIKEIKLRPGIDNHDYEVKMKAVRRFDPEQGVRLVSYALHWIKAEIHEYIVRNWRMVKVATTKAQRKLFFNLRSLKQSLRAQEGNGRETLTQDQIDVVARELDVKREEVMEMEARMAGGDVMLDPAPREDGEDAFGPIAYLADADHEPTAMLESRQRDVLVSDGLASALESLDERSRRIVEERWLKVNDDGSGGMTLHDLAAEYGISAERVRQIEVAAMKKMKAALASYA